MPIVEGTCGWGRLFQLYPDHLRVHGAVYELRHLTEIRPVYRSLLGLPSARLELTFGQQRVILRGIAAVEDVRKMVDYLQRTCPRARLLAAPGHEPGPTESAGAGVGANVDPAAAETTIPLAARETPTALMRALAPTGWQMARRELLQRRRARLQEERERRQEATLSRQPGRRFPLKDPLPPVQVPIRLAYGERAYYCCQATLCNEQLRPFAPPEEAVRDHGLLILTDRRLIYLGRRCQVLLGYDHLLQVSRQRNGVAFLADHWRRRELFTMRRPLECVLCLEKLLWRFQQERQLSTLMSVELEEQDEEEANPHHEARQPEQRTGSEPVTR
ncbi:hypothetical protein [Thermogemmatispora onikobensis]|uniref:hypothetical protein n=1 Tax=Thermogemmatispora onikobensis TaxID=732234 RepID=UPI0008529249|nr:hypothetical protein [Thermogemmatispora onikobensis]